MKQTTGTKMQQSVSQQGVQKRRRKIQQIFAVGLKVDLKQKTSL